MHESEFDMFTFRYWVPSRALSRYKEPFSFFITFSFPSTSAPHREWLAFYTTNLTDEHRVPLHTTIIQTEELGPGEYPFGAKLHASFQDLDWTSIKSDNVSVDLGYQYHVKEHTGFWSCSRPSCCVMRNAQL
ncbi:hypothetical protein [Absidia glauca]|uniref:Uncharacterized protein n=1 Tax=Absidia glauca TaxID=4829 RepID=A0A163JF06_ABSGL|nr:hypothetical protein [Absidia glauca]